MREYEMSVRVENRSIFEMCTEILSDSFVSLRRITDFFSFETSTLFRILCLGSNTSTPLYFDEFVSYDQLKIKPYTVSSFVNVYAWSTI